MINSIIQKGDAHNIKDEIYQGLIKQLLLLDNDVFLSLEYDKKFQVVIVGGAAMVALGAITRKTEDIDVLTSTSSINSFFANRGINTNVNAYICNFPYNFEDRLVKIPITTRAINFYTASLEDIVISKLYSPRDKDFADVSNSRVISALNWELLHFLATDPNEAMASAMNEFRYREFLSKYLDYERRYCSETTNL